MENLKSMKQCLVAQAQSQMGNLQAVDAKELGEVVDMIKDLEEAIYYCTIVEAMEGKNKEQQPNTYYYSEHYYPQSKMMPYDYERDMDKDYGKMYYSGGGMSNGNSSNMSSSSGSGNSGTAHYYERELPLNLRDEREGRSPMRRKMYIESKEMHHGREKQLKELEQYMQELSYDITEMIKDASPEEKQMLQKKIAILASKIDV